jgi:hypothetical protein
MKKQMNSKLLPFFIVVVVISSCANDNAIKQNNQPNNDTVATRTLDEKNKPLLEENDCVFDTNSYKFTTDALKRYNKHIQFVWDSKQKSATTRLNNNDTLQLSIGGCNHFGYAATLYSSIHFDNTKELIKKAQWLAKTFFDNGFDTKYDECIRNGQFEPSYNYDTINMKSFDIQDQDTSITNMVYNGFSFYRAGNRTKIVISGYIN